MRANDHPHDHDHGPLSAPGRAWLRVALWLVLSALTLWVLLGGHSDLYIAPNVRWTLWLAVGASLALAGVDGAAARARGVELPAWFRWRPSRGALAGYVVLFAPLAAGLLIPPATLGAGSILAHAGVVTLLAPPGAPGGDAAGTAPRQMSLLQAQDALRRDALPAGTLVSLTGFAYRQPGLPAGEWLLTRFITPHCVAEAQPLAIVVAGSAPPDNAWVTVTGRLQSGAADGHAAAVLMPVAIATIPTPLDPYLIY